MEDLMKILLNHVEIHHHEKEEKLNYTEVLLIHMYFDDAILSCDELDFYITHIPYVDN